MRHACNPLTAVLLALYHTDTAVRHPNAPFALVAAVIRQVHAVHHVILVAVDVLVAQAADIVHLHHGRLPVFVPALIPGILVNQAVNQRIRDFVVDGIRFIIADGVCHPVFCRPTRCSVVGMLSGTALFLHVPAPIPCIAQVRDAAVHQRIYLLHTPLLAVIVEVRPGHACRGRSSGYAGTQLTAHHRTAHNGTQMFLIGHPIRFHVLYLVAVAQHHAVKLCRVQDGEMQGRCTFRNVCYQIHAGFKFQADGRHHNTLQDVSLRISKHTADKPRAGNTREAHAPVAGYIHLTYRIGLVSRIGFHQCRLSAHNLAFTQPAALCLLDGIQCQYRRVRNRGHFVLRITAVAGVLLVVQIVVDAFAPVKRLIHHPVTLAAVQLRHRAIVHILRIGIEVRAFVMQGEIGYFTVRVVHFHLLPGYLHLPARGHLGHLGQYAVALGQDGIHMPAHFVRIAEFVPRLVVQVRNIGIVGHTVVKLNHRIGRLLDGQFRITGGILLQFLIGQILRQGQLAPQSRMPVIHGTRLCIRSVVVILLQQGSVVFPVYLQHEALQLAAAVQSGLVQAFQHSEPVDAGAVGVAVAPHIIDAFQYQATVGQLGQIFQEQFLNRVRQA